MAIYHYHREIGKRSQGKNSVFAVAYIRGEKRTCDRIETTKDFSRKEGVVYKNTFLPDDAPQWAQALRSQSVTDSTGKKHEDLTGEQFSTYAWNQIEFIEKRIDSQLYFHDDIALPNNLSLADSITLVEEFVKDNLAQDGIFCDVAIHWDEGNHHFHVIMPMRPLSDSGFDKKIRYTRAEMGNQISVVRQAWSNYANRKMQECGLNERIDHRSYKDRGIDLEPKVKLGKAKHSVNEHIHIRKKSENVSIQAMNAQSVSRNPQILSTKLSQEHTNLSSEVVTNELNRYIPVIASLAEKEAQSDTKTSDEASEILERLEKDFGIINEKALKKTVLESTSTETEFNRIYEEVIGHESLLSLGLGEDGREHYVSRKAFDMENAVIANSAKLAERSTLACSLKSIAEIEKKYTLNQAQTKALKHLTTGKDMALVCGYAGTGKTYLLKAAKEIWQERELKIIGLSTSGKASSGIEDETGISSYTLAGFTRAVESGKLNVDDQTVLVMDEMGMTSLDDMHKVLEITRSKGAKFSGIGDIEQTQPVGRGASFRAMVEECGAVYLDEIIRQKVEWQREATFYFETNQTDKGFALYESHEHVHLFDSTEDKRRHIISKWYDSQLAHSEKSLDAFIIAAFQNDCVDKLNTLAREKLVNEGVLSQGIQISGKFIAVGERLLFTKNDWRIGVKNGQFATVTALSDEQVKVQLDNGNELILQHKDLKQCRYGYAATVHKLQGYTGDHTFLDIDGKGWDRHLFLVGSSRHRESLKVCASKDDFASLESLKASVSRHGLNDILHDFPVAYSQRRGFDSQVAAQKAIGLLGRGKAHLQSALGYLFNIQQTVEEDAKTRVHNIEKEELLKRRQDAVLVAEFADRRVVIAQQLNQLINGSDVDKEILNQEIYGLSRKNGNVAQTILADYARYKIGCERNRIDVETLEKAKAFSDKSSFIEQIVSDWRSYYFTKPSDSYLVSENVKAYYTHLCQLMPNSDERNALLRHMSREADAIRREKALENFGINRRADINLVMYFKQLDADIIELFVNNESLCDETKEKMAQFSIKRDEAAHKLLLIKYSDTLLEHFSVSKERLEKYAAYHSDRSLVKHFSMLPSTSMAHGSLEKQHLAHLIKKDVKRYGRYVHEILSDTWKSVNIENWYFEKRLSVAQMSSELREETRQVRQYKTMASSAYQAWQRVFNSHKHEYKNSNLTITKAQGLTWKRKQIAHFIMQKLETHIAALASEKVNTKRLSDDARVVEYLERYRNTSKEPLKLHMASYVQQNIKNYRAGLAVYGLEKEVYEKAAHHQYLKSIKQAVTQAHKELIRLAYAYQKTSSEASTQYRFVKQHAKKQNVSVFDSKLVTQHYAKRDELALKLQTLIGQNPDIKTQLNLLKINENTVAKQAKNHTITQQIKGYAALSPECKVNVAKALLGDKSAYRLLYQYQLSFDTLKRDAGLVLREKVNVKSGIVSDYEAYTSIANSGISSSNLDERSTLDYTVAEYFIKEQEGLAGVNLSDLQFNDNYLYSNERYPAIVMPHMNQHGTEIGKTALILHESASNKLEVIDYQVMNGDGYYVAHSNDKADTLYIADSLLDAKAIAATKPQAVVLFCPDKNYSAALQWSEQTHGRIAKVTVVSDNHLDQTKKELVNCLSPTIGDRDLYLAKGRTNDDQVTHIRVADSFSRLEKVRQNQSYVHAIKVDVQKIEKATLKTRLTKLLKQKQHDVPVKSIYPKAQEKLPFYYYLTSKELAATKQYLQAHQAFKKGGSATLAIERMKAAANLKLVLKDKIGLIKNHPQSAILPVKKLNSREITQLLSKQEKLSMIDIKAIVSHSNQLHIDAETRRQLQQQISSPEISQLRGSSLTLIKKVISQHGHKLLQGHQQLDKELVSLCKQGLSNYDNTINKKEISKESKKDRSL